MADTGTRTRVYYQAEVRRRAAMQPGNPPPRVGDLGMGDATVVFIVDASGRVPPDLIYVLPGSDSALAERYARVLPRWQFYPAELSDQSRVRQIVRYAIQKRGSVVVMDTNTLIHRPALPAFVLGQFMDDYGNSFRLSFTLFEQLPRNRFHIVEWNVDEQYFVARNDSSNSSDAGRWTRVDWMPFSGMAPFTWGFCLTAYRAPTREAARATPPANRATPRTGCNGYPFSRMKAAP